MGGGSGGQSEGASLFRKMRKGEKSSRASRTSNYFQNLIRTSMLQGRKMDSSMTPVNVSASKQGKALGSVDMQKALIM